MQKRWLTLGLGGLLGGLIFFLVYAIANGGFMLTAFQRVLPTLFGVVAGVFLADAWYIRRKQRTTSVDREEDNPSQQR
jgi:hypothetical protein